MKVTIVHNGTTPLAQHNIQLANPANEFAKAIKEITDKQSKTDVDYERLQELEFLGGLYWEKDIGVYVDSSAVMRTFENAAKITKKGTAIVRSLIPMTDRVPLIYEGPRKPKELWADQSFRWLMPVRNPSTRGVTMRMRPQFRKWSLVFEAEFLEDAGLSKEQLKTIVEQAGRSNGLLEGRKIGKGRFLAEVRFGNGKV